MLNYGQVVPMISSILGHHSESIFYHQRLYGAENPFFYAWQAAFHIWKINFQRILASVHMEPNFLVFESFPMILNDVKLLFESLLIYMQVHAFFIFDVKFTVLKLEKPLTTTSLI